MRRIAFLMRYFAIFLGTVVSAQEKPAVIGQVDLVETISAEASAVNGLAFGRDYTMPAGHFGRIGFRLVGLLPVDGTIVVTNAKWSDSIPLSRLSRDVTTWSKVGSNSLTRVEIRSAKPSISNPIKIEIYRAFKGVGGRLESVIVPPSHFEEAYEFESDPVLKGASRSIGILIFPTDARTYASCTGFLTSGGRFVTNAHCIRTGAECAKAAIIFGYRLKKPDEEEVGSQYRCKSIENLPDLLQLDLAILRLDPSPSASLGYLPLAPTELATGVVTLLQHPSGEPLKASRTHCAIAMFPLMSPTSKRPDDFGHTCDAANGSSGSPLLDAKGRVVGVHHWGIDSTLADITRTNRAIRLEKLREALVSRSTN